MAIVQPDIGLGKILVRRAELSASKPAITFEGKTLSYREFTDRVLSIASVLRAGGVCHGDRVAYLGFNTPTSLEMLYACSCLGAIFVPLNFRLTGHELQYIINDAGVHTLVCDDSLQALIDAERDNLVCQRYVSFETEYSGWDYLPTLLSAVDPLAASASVSADEVAFIMYTSGTTGLPKGAMLTHGNLFWNGINQVYFEQLMGSVTLTCAPLFHIGGLNVTTLSTLAQGMHLILHRQFDPAMVLRDIEKYKVNCMFGAPAMFLFMSQTPDFATTNLDSVNAFICGGAPVPVPLINLYGSRNIKFCQGYGLTETAPMAALLSTELALEKVGSTGTAPMFTEVRIVDDNNKVVDANERGEVCVRGPNVMKGYWNKPEATAAAIDEQDWFHTGDIGYMDNEGFVYICDRVKDMVISGGENVYPAEIEGVLYEHEAIAEVAVIGTPDEKWGEAVTAVVVLNEQQSLDLEKLRDFSAQKLARYKLPLKLHIIDELPRNPAGKVLKFKLKEQFC